MIKHTDVGSENFTPAKELMLIQPRELPQGEVKEGNFIVEMEQNTSVVDRPTLGTVIAIGKEVDSDYLNKTIIWEERAGQDLFLKDGQFLVIGEEAILGRVNNE